MYRNCYIKFHDCFMNCCHTGQYVFTYLTHRAWKTKKKKKKAWLSKYRWAGLWIKYTAFSKLFCDEDDETLKLSCPSSCSSKRFCFGCCTCLDIRCLFPLYAHHSEVLKYWQVSQSENFLADFLENVPDLNVKISFNIFNSYLYI